jgi:serine/threonine protein kinase
VTGTVTAHVGGGSFAVSSEQRPRPSNDGGSLAAMPLESGQVFAGYTIVRLVGSGGMGEVYLAQHPRLPRQDALKVLPPSFSADDEYRQRFSREADLAATLWHPHIVGVHDRGEYDGRLWISMDFVDGHDAAQLLVDRYPSGMPAATSSRSSRRWPTPSTTPISASCCTATSSRPTSCSPTRTGPGGEYFWRTSVLPATPTTSPG